MALWKTKAGTPISYFSNIGSSPRIVWSRYQRPDSIMTRQSHQRSRSMSILPDGHSRRCVTAAGTQSYTNCNVGYSAYSPSLTVLCLMRLNDVLILHSELLQCWMVCQVLNIAFSGHPCGEQVEMRSSGIVFSVAAMSAHFYIDLCLRSLFDLQFYSGFRCPRTTSHYNEGYSYRSVSEPHGYARIYSSRQRTSMVALYRCQ